jgi:hypothetical protein
MILIGRHMIGAARRHPFIHELGCPAGEFRAVDQDTNLGTDGARTRIEVETPDGNRLTIEYHNLACNDARDLPARIDHCRFTWRLPSSTRENSDWAGSSDDTRPNRRANGLILRQIGRSSLRVTSTAANVAVFDADWPKGFRQMRLRQCRPRQRWC